jgi:RNA polymerase II subunit A small phosphatase-like protein
MFTANPSVLAPCAIRMSPKQSPWLCFFPFFKERIYCPPPLPSDGRKTAVLDLDETLIHTTVHRPSPLIDSFRLLDGSHLEMRPGLQSFMNYAIENFEVFAYTFAERGYAERIIRIIAPLLPFDRALFRDFCCLQNDGVYEGFEMLGRNLKNVVLIDDNPESGNSIRRIRSL